MAKSVNYLPQKHKNLSLNSQHTLKKKKSRVHAGWVDTGDSQNSMAKSMRLGFSEKPGLKTYGGKQSRKTHDVSFLLPNTRVYSPPAHAHNSHEHMHTPHTRSSRSSLRG